MFPRKKRGEKLHDVGIGRDFLGMTPRPQATKEKSTCDYLRLKTRVHPRM